MDSQVSELILTYQKIAYLKTDARLNITEAGGSLELLQYLELKNPALHAVNVENPNHGTYFTFTNPDIFTTLTLSDAIPEIEQHSQQLLSVLHGVEKEIFLPGLTLASAEHESESIVNIRVVSDFDRSGRIRGLIHLLEDVSDIRSLRKQIDSLSQSVEMLQNQLDMVAHELGTPLTLISGYLEILADLGESEMNNGQLQCMELIESSVDNLHIVVKSLFDIVFAEADGLRLALQPVDINLLLDGAALEFQHQLERKSQKIHIKSGSGKLRAMCDQTRVIQVMNNLLSNASKFSPAGSIIEIEITSDIDDGVIQIAITDNGAGITGDEQNAIFERFYRTQFGRRAEAQGAGLGLYLCRLIVSMHGGEIWCQNSSTSGSTFCFTLPSTDLPSIGGGDDFEYPNAVNKHSYQANGSG